MGDASCRSLNEHSCVFEQSFCDVSCDTKVIIPCNSFKWKQTNHWRQPSNQSPQRAPNHWRQPSNQSPQRAPLWQAASSSMCLYLYLQYSWRLDLETGLSNSSKKTRIPAEVRNFVSSLPISATPSMFLRNKWFQLLWTKLFHLHLSTREGV